jgi:hypothetical protein
MKTGLINVLRFAAALLVSIMCFPAAAAELQEGAVVYVHSADATNTFLTSLGMPSGKAPISRLAIVRIVEGASDDVSFVLVWVPDYLSLQPDDRVEFAPVGEDVSVAPGNGVVTKVAPSLASIH